ncbi:MAG TPA: bifunctional phosphoglucose/phosphomannose isomerase [Actinomycetota bacterium]
MLGAVEGWAEQWDAACRAAERIAPIAGTFDSVLVCGMGGSGIAGDVVRSLLEPALPIPIRLVRGHEIPGFVGPRTLVAALSYSGNTAETLACFDQAVERGATLVAVTAGGALAQRALSAGAILCSDLPAGVMPRAALPSLVVPLAVAVGRAGVADAGPLLEMGAAIAHRSVLAWRRDVPTDRNLAKRIAVRIGERFPIVWGTEGTQTVAAMRWKCQLAENAKLPAIMSTLPELGHNDIVGVHAGHPAIKDAILLALRVEGGHPKQEARLKAALDIAGRSVGLVEIVTIESFSPAERLIESLILADFVSVYSAILRGVDPGPIEAIDLLKAAQD